MTAPLWMHRAQVTLTWADRISDDERQVPADHRLVLAVTSTHPRAVGSVVLATYPPGMHAEAKAAAERIAAPNEWPVKVSDRVARLAEEAPAAADWFNILGKPVPAAAISAAFDLAVAEGLPPEEANIVLPIVAREIAHDEPERAIRTLRRWVSEHGQGAETFVIRLLAVLGTVGR